MSPHRFPRPVRLALYALASAILLLLCLLPEDELPDPRISDKLEHLIAWFVLTVTGYVLAPKRRWAIPTYALGFGLFVELLQRLMGFGRQGDWLDLTMDAIGVAGAALGFLALRRWRTPAEVPEVG